MHGLGYETWCVTALIDELSQQCNACDTVSMHISSLGIS